MTDIKQFPDATYVRTTRLISKLSETLDEEAEGMSFPSILGAIEVLRINTQREMEKSEEDE